MLSPPLPPSEGPVSLKNYGNMFNGTSRSGHFLLAGRRNAVSSTLLNRSAPLGTIIRCCFPQEKQVALQVIFDEIDASIQQLSQIMTTDCLLDCTLFNTNCSVSWTSLVKFIYSEKATKFCKISTLYLSYVSSNSQIYGGDFAKFCGLLRIYEL